MSFNVTGVKAVVDDGRFITFILRSGAMLHLPIPNKSEGNHSISILKKENNYECELAVDVFGTDHNSIDNDILELEEFE